VQRPIKSDLHFIAVTTAVAEKRAAIFLTGSTTSAIAIVTNSYMRCNPSLVKMPRVGTTCELQKYGQTAVRPTRRGKLAL